MKNELKIAEHELAIFKEATKAFLKIVGVADCTVLVSYDHPLALFEAGKQFESLLTTLDKLENSFYLPF